MHRLSGSIVGETKRQIRASAKRGVVLPKLHMPQTKKKKRILAFTLKHTITLTLSLTHIDSYGSQCLAAALFACAAIHSFSPLVWLSFRLITFPDSLRAWCIRRQFSIKTASVLNYAYTHFYTQFKLDANEYTCNFFRSVCVCKCVVKGGKRHLMCCVW